MVNLRKCSSFCYSLFERRRVCDDGVNGFFWFLCKKKNKIKKKCFKFNKNCESLKQVTKRKVVLIFFILQKKLEIKTGLKMKMQRMSSGSQDRMKNNKSSILLSHEENDLVFSLLGRKCQVRFQNLLVNRWMSWTIGFSNFLWTKEYNFSNNW